MCYYSQASTITDYLVKQLLQLLNSNFPHYFSLQNFAWLPPAPVLKGRRKYALICLLFFLSSQYFFEVSPQLRPKNPAQKLVVSLDYYYLFSMISIFMASSYKTKRVIDYFSVRMQLTVCFFFTWTLLSYLYNLCTRPSEVIWENR